MSGTAIVEAPLSSPTGRPAPWTGGRIASVVAGSLLAVLATVLTVAGAGMFAVAAMNRDGGYVTMPDVALSSGGYAVTTDPIRLGRHDMIGWRHLVGTVRIRVTATDPQTPVFIGVARTADAARYLDGVARSSVRSLHRHASTYTEHSGAAPRSLPSEQTFWAVSAAGTGTQTVTWHATSGSWTVVVMNATAKPLVDVTADAGATVPDLPWVAGGVLAGGLLLGVVATVLIAVPVRRAGRAAAAA